MYLNDEEIDDLVSLAIEEILSDPDLGEYERGLLLAERDAAFDADEPVSLRWAPGHEPDEAEDLFLLEVCA